MGIGGVRTDSATEGRRGPGLLRLLRDNLWRRDCRTCGSPLSRWPAPSLVVGPIDEYATVSLHHKGCLTPAVPGTVADPDRRPRAGAWGARRDAGRRRHRAAVDADQPGGADTRCVGWPGGWAGPRR